MSGNDILIRFEDVHRSFGSKHVLRGLDLEIRRGETYVVIGRSGTGKSVTLKHMVGLLAPDRGRVLVDGVHVAGLGVGKLREFRKRFGYLFQSGALINWMTVGENVSLPLLEHTKHGPEEIREEARACIEGAGRSGGYVLGSGCVVPRAAPLENIAALRRAAERYGTYEDGVLS